MDYQGQQLAEILFHLIILSFGSVGWVMGYMEQNFMIVFKIWLVGVVLSVLVRVGQLTALPCFSSWQRHLRVL
jgi:signal peptidase complex subunit 1